MIRSLMDTILFRSIAIGTSVCMDIALPANLKIGSIQCFKSYIFHLFHILFNHHYYCNV